MSLSTQPYKGARDFYPEDKRIQKYMFDVIRKVVESYGYQEYDAPLLEPLELYQAKTSDEIVSEQTYKFEDRGGRQVVIRPEMTPTVSRMVAGRRQELAYPLRWYSIPNLWRYERPQAGRLREHWQLNVDLFGVVGIDADEEIIQVADSILKAFGASEDMFEVRVNSRKAMIELLAGSGFDEPAAAKAIGAFDRLGKQGFEDYLAKNFDETDRQKLHDFLDNTPGEKILDTDSGKNLAALLQRLKDTGVNARPDISINRGFDYYSDIVFEVYDTSPDNNRSMFGGGRYDGLVGQFGVEPVPTVGFGMGDVTLRNFLDAHNLLPKLKPETDVIAILVGDVHEKAQATLKKLREAGVNAAVDSSGRKIDSQIKSAVKSGVRHALFIGEQELASGQYKLRDLEKGEEKQLTIDQVASSLISWRQD